MLLLRPIHFCPKSWGSWLKRYPRSDATLVRIRFKISTRTKIRVRVRLRSGCSDYNLATIQSIILKLRTDALSVLVRVKRLTVNRMLTKDYCTKGTSINKQNVPSNTSKVNLISAFV